MLEEDIFIQKKNLSKELGDDGEFGDMRGVELTDERKKRTRTHGI